MNHIIRFVFLLNFTPLLFRLCQQQLQRVTEEQLRSSRPTRNMKFSEKLTAMSLTFQIKFPRN